MGRSGFRKAYQTGKGSIIIRGKINVETISKSKEAIVITEIPYSVKKSQLIESIAKAKENYQDTLSIVLPPLITDLSDIFSFKWPASSPNYITQGNVIGSTVDHTEKEKLAGNIVFMPNADPGFDWIFLQPIAGLVTTWGGANSHMAIRAGELGIPAVIGAGEILYEKWSKADIINLDCGKQLVEVLR